MTRYGLPWMGSKSRYAKWILSHIPKEPILVDLFAGGCAVTDAALERGQRVIACDRCWEALDLFDKTLYDGPPPMPNMPKNNQELRESDLLTRLCWSYGYQGSYLASQTPDHNAGASYRRVARIHTRHRASGGWVRYYTGDSLSYEPPREPCVIYADPPYAGTQGYDCTYGAHGVPEATTKMTVYRLRDLGRPWIMSECQPVDGLAVIDQISINDTGFNAGAPPKTEYLLTEPKWAQYFCSRLL